MRRKHKTRYQWLLPTGTVGPAADVQDDSNGRVLALSSPVDGTTDVGFADLLNDTPSEDVILNQATVTTMVASAGNEYFIRRIVGKLFASTNVAADSNAASAYLLGVGIFIARAGDADQGAGLENLPINASNAAGAIDNYSPLRTENIREPWIWRRTWVLGRSGQAASQFGQHQFPSTTAGYGSIQDGPHIDAKTARRVRDGERLWLVAASRNYVLNEVATTNPGGIEIYLDYRVLGAMRKAHNRSAF